MIYAAKLIFFDEMTKQEPLVITLFSIKVVR